MSVALSTQQPLFILYNLVAKDFKVRYRNMSLGIFWSLLNPLIMMGVLTFVFAVVFEPPPIRYYPLFILMGLLPFNFFTLAWSSGTNSIVDNSSLIKKVPFRRELVPISVVLANTVHYLIQIGFFLLAVAIVVGPNRQWLWIPVLLGLQMAFVCGAALACSALDVYYRDVRYVVESANLVLFWLVPIFYPLELVEPRFAWIYQVNPIAAVTVMTRRMLLEGISPGLSLGMSWGAVGTLWKAAIVSLATLALGIWVFRRIQKDFSDYL
jgi:ABC-type polysaccharide/polyol phosphate export permease